MYLRPETVAEAVAALAACGGRILAGGTDFYPALGETSAASRLVDISRVAELRGIRFEEDHVRIGGAHDLDRHRARSDLPPAFDALKAAAREVGSMQIQNVGTIAGNLCNASPAADGVPPLLALDAEVELASRAGRRRCRFPSSSPATADTARAGRDPHRDPRARAASTRPLGLPQARRPALSRHLHRHGRGSRRASTAPGASAQARVAVGACSAVAQRLPALEAALVGAAAGGRPRRMRVPRTISTPLQPDRRCPRDRRLSPRRGADAGAACARSLRRGEPIMLEGAGQLSPSPSTAARSRSRRRRSTASRTCCATISA